MNSTDNRNVVLVGPMGSGKSTIGRALASLLNKEFIDSDQVVEERCGADIPWIFDIEGEEGFRARETAVLQSFAPLNNSVIATGGGAVLREENRQILRNLGTVVYLSAPVEVLFSRVAKDKNRPLLQVDDPLAVYSAIFAERDPLYRQTADIVFASNANIAPQEVARRLRSRLLENQ